MCAQVWLIKYTYSKFTICVYIYICTYIYILYNCHITRTHFLRVETAGIQSFARKAAWSRRRQRPQRAQGRPGTEHGESSRLYQWIHSDAMWYHWGMPLELSKCSTVFREMSGLCLKNQEHPESCRSVNAWCPFLKGWKDGATAWVSFC